MENLINTFHNLGGQTISEHQKKFSTYRQDLAKSGIDFDAYFAKLQAKNRQEEIFRIKLLQDHKRYDILYDILKTGDKINSAVILKSADFLSIFTSIRGGDFVQKICPELSYVNRVKIINKLGLTLKDCEVAKDLFENVRRKYGLAIAKPLLNACSEEYIQEMVVKYDLILNQALLIRLYKKHPNFLHFYYAKKGGFDKDIKVARYVVNVDISAYHSLLRYGCPKLGKAGLKKFLKTYRLEVLKYPKLTIGKWKVLLQNLSRDEYLVYLRSKLPINEFQIDMETMCCFKALPMQERGTALFTCFKKVHGFNLTDEVELVSDEVLEMLSIEDRMCFDLKGHVEMLPIETSLPKLKALFLSTKNREKQLEFGQKLIKTCTLNGDNEGLLDVLKFFCQNFNPLPTPCFEAIGKLSLEKLSAQHWDYINELRLCYKIEHGEANMVCDYEEKVLLYKMLNGIDYVEDLKSLCKRNSYYYNISFNGNYFIQEQECLMKCCQILEQIFKGDDLKAARNNLIHQIISFNKKHPKLALPYITYADVLRALIGDIDGERYFHYLYAIENLLRTKHADILSDEEVLDGLIRNAHNVYWDTLYMWFLKRRPDLVVKYSDSLFEADRLSERIYYEISKMHYTDLYKVVVDKALVRMNGEEPSGFVAAIKLLSCIQSLDLQHFIEKYLPGPECKIDPFTPNMTDVLTIQRSIIKTIKNASPPADNFTKTLYFCKGDYLKYALEPLYYSVCHSPESTVEGVLEELLTRAVSVRKHALHLVTSVGTVDNKFRILKRFVETETNTSLKNFAITKLLRCFIDERNEEWFGLLKEHIGLLNNDDWYTRCLAFKLINIPNIFYDEYVEMLWDTFKNPSGILNEIKIVSDNLSQKIIKDVLYNDKCYSDEVFTFTRSYILRNKDTDLEYLKPPIPNKLEKRLEYIKTKRRFMEHTCKEFLKDFKEDTKRKIIVLDRLGVIFKSLEFNLLVDITKLFLVKMEPNDLSEEPMEIDSIEEIMDVGNKIMENPLEERNNRVHPTNDEFMKILANFVVYQLKSSLEIYGFDVIPILGDLVRYYLEDFYKNIYGNAFGLLLRLVEVILSKEDAINVILLSIFLLPKDSTQISGYKKRRLEVLEKMRKTDSDVVQVYIEWFLEHCQK